MKKTGEPKDRAEEITQSVAKKDNEIQGMKEHLREKVK